MNWPSENDREKQAGPWRAGRADRAPLACGVVVVRHVIEPAAASGTGSESLVILVLQHLAGRRADLGCDHGP